MILIGHDAGGVITHLIRGEDAEMLAATAAANDCAGWLEVAEPPNAAEWLVADGALIPRPAALPSAGARRAGMAISPRQLFIALASPSWSLITPAEAVAAATTGAMPAAVDAMVSALPELEEMQARVTWARMQEVRRVDPLVDLIAGTRPDMTPEAIDAFFEFAAGL